MLKNISLLILLFVSAISNAQTTDKPKILYGVCTKTDLEAAPFDTWFKKNYQDYTPNAATVTTIKKEAIKDVTIKVFFGTWCGDSKREVPHFMKLLDAADFPSSKVMLIATGASDSLYKQSPQHEESGSGIYKVPAFIFYRNGKEINRIVEFPALSLEKDMLAIVQGRSYTPNYASLLTLDKWLADGILLDSNISIRSLAMQVKPLVNTEHELNGLGYVLLAQKKMKEAIAVFQINYFLYPQSANVASSLGEGYYVIGDAKNAVYYLENALGKNTDPKALRGILDVLYKAKSL
jgi:thiol-disulfide isomerase/thioredoxin